MQSAVHAGRSGRTRRPGALACALLLLGAAGGAAAGCDAPPLDALRRDGGAAPDPTGLLRGSVVYAGRRPSCEHAADGTPVRVRGHVVLTLFAWDNPPPPAGSATSALNLLTLSGRRLFSVDDCMPLSPAPEDLAPITREIDFEWPEIPLATGAAVSGRLPTADYQIRGFYDDDGDFNPFFAVRNLATAGDVGGGAVVDARAAIPEYRRISFGHVEEHPLGQAIGSVVVTLGAPITTERPMFELARTSRALSADATVPLVADAALREEALFALSRMRVELVRDGASLDDGHAWSDALTAAGIDFDFRPSAHGLPIRPVDADGDGAGDPHPILGSSGVPWIAPIVLLRRARSPAEVAARVPDVLFVATVRPTFVLGADQGFVARRTAMGVDVIVPPVAIMVTNPAAPATCRVPLVAPGNVAELYESQPVVDCQELPTGNYDVNVLSGLAGARPVDVAAACQPGCEAGGTDAATCRESCAAYAALETESGIAFEGGLYSSQAWSVPNELGCPDPAYDTTPVNQLDPPRPDGTLPECGDPGSVMLPHQGRVGGMAVVDPSPASDVDPEATTDGHGAAACETALHTSGPTAGTAGPVDYATFPAAFVALCCGPVLPLCGLPLCPLRTAAETPGYPEAVRGGGADGTVFATREVRVLGVDYELGPGGAVLLRCTPFLPPAQCCAAR